MLILNPSIRAENEVLASCPTVCELLIRAQRQESRAGAAPRPLDEHLVLKLMSTDSWLACNGGFGGLTREGGCVKNNGGWNQAMKAPSVLTDWHLYWSTSYISGFHNPNF